MNSEFYGVYSERLAEVERFMQAEIKAILDSLGSDSETAPAEHVKSRVKSPESMEQKLKKLGFPVSVESGLKNLSDIIGFRVVTHFVGDIYAVLGLIERSGHWRVVTIKDYIASPKPNGYRSLHVILAVPFSVNGIDEIQTEIQLRTIAMDCWASLEHQLRYKKSIENTALLEAELKRCADEMASTDLSMQTIRDLIRSKAGNGEKENER